MLRIAGIFQPKKNSKKILQNKGKKLWPLRIKEMLDRLKVNGNAYLRRPTRVRWFDQHLNDIHLLLLVQQRL